ncbi:MAG: hypothetical protein OXI84_00330 [bacterium]|nr:hypothetical protein [bacterium]
MKGSPLKYLLDLNDSGTWGNDPTGEGDTVVLRSTDIRLDGSWRISDPAVRHVNRHDKVRKRLAFGDIVVVKSSGSPEHLGKSAIVTKEVAAMRPCFANFVQRLRPSPSTDSRYIWYVLNSKWAADEMASLGNTTTGLRNLNGTIIGSLRIPARGIHEQRAIADYLDIETNRIDTLIAKKRRMIQLLGEYDRRTLDDLLDGIRQNGLARLGYLAEVRSGLTLGGARANSRSHVTLPYLRVANVQHDRLDLSEVKSVTVDTTTARRTALRHGDVLMTEGGDIDKLGRGTVWRGEIDPCLHQNHVFAVRVRTKNLLPEFLALLTRTSYARQYFERTGVRSTNLASTSSSKVADFRIPLPSRSTQSHLVSVYQRKWETLERTRVATGLQVDLLNERRQALITTAVTGESPVPGMAAWQRCLAEGHAPEEG